MKFSRVSKINFFHSKESSLRFFVKREGPLFSSREENSYISQKQAIKTLKKNKNKVQRIILTGGNPLSAGEDYKFLKKIKKLGFSLKLETYGFYPEKIKEAIEKDLLDSVKLVIPSSKKNYHKAFDKKSSYNYITRKVEDTIELVKESQLEDSFLTSLADFLEKRDILEIGKWIAPASSYTLVKKQKEDIPHLKFSESGISSSEVASLRRSLSPFIERINIIV